MTIWDEWKRAAEQKQKQVASAYYRSLSSEQTPATESDKQDVRLLAHVKPNNAWDKRFIRSLYKPASEIHPGCTGEIVNPTFSAKQRYWINVLCVNTGGRYMDILETIKAVFTKVRQAVCSHKKVEAYPHKSMSRILIICHSCGKSTVVDNPGLYWSVIDLAEKYL